LSTSLKILLAVSSEHIHEYLSKLIQGQQDMIIVGDTSQMVETLMATARTEAQVVILELPRPDVDPGICSHLLTEFPDLVVLAISSNREKAISYQQRIVKRRLNNPSDRDILSTIRQAKRTDH
jgi:DNA-binding NarL/FixJ family response regulator